jgi:hypothetical protein
MVEIITNPYLQMVALNRATKIKKISVKDAEILLLELDINLHRRRLRRC